MQIGIGASYLPVSILASAGTFQPAFHHCVMKRKAKESKRSLDKGAGRSLYTFQIT